MYIRNLIYVNTTTVEIMQNTIKACGGGPNTYTLCESLFNTFHVKLIYNNYYVYQNNNIKSSVLGTNHRECHL